jgi:hypothetical protein
MDHASLSNNVGPGDSLVKSVAQVCFRIRLPRKTAMENVSSQDVSAFWFSEKSRWYAKDDHFDPEIRQRFLATYEAAYAGELDEWRRTPESLLARITCSINSLATCSGVPPAHSPPMRMPCV